MNDSNGLESIAGVLAAYAISRAAQLLFNPELSDQAERQMIGEFLEKLGKSGMAQESARLATEQMEP